MYEVREPHTFYHSECYIVKPYTVYRYEYILKTFPFCFWLDFFAQDNKTCSLGRIDIYCMFGCWLVFLGECYGKGLLHSTVHCTLYTTQQYKATLGPKLNCLSFSFSPSPEIWSGKSEKYTERAKAASFLLTIGEMWRKKGLFASGEREGGGSFSKSGVFESGYQVGLGCRGDVVAISGLAAN